MKRKILFYIHSLNKGGAERVMLTIAQELNRGDDYDVVILTDKKDDLEYTLPDGLARINIEDDKNSTTTFSRLKAIRKHVKEQAPDKVVVFMLSSAIRAAVALCLTRSRIIACVRSNPYDDYSRGRNRHILLWCMKRCERIVCQTQYQKDFFPDNLKDRCVVISNPIFSEFATKAHMLSENREASNNIVATGRLYDYKNHKLLIEAFSKIADDHKSINVVIYGEGPYRGELEQLIRDKKLETRVFLPGDSDHVAEDIANALIYVLPSDTEGLPNALMEAMALGLPAISTDCPCGGPKSIIDDGINGILVPTGDVDRMAQAIENLLSNENLRQNMGREAQRILKTNELSKIVDQWKEIIR